MLRLESFKSNKIFENRNYNQKVSFSKKIFTDYLFYKNNHLLDTLIYFGDKQK